MLKFNLAIPDEFSDVSGRLLVMAGDNNMANGEIINSGGKYIYCISDQYSKLVKMHTLYVHIYVTGSVKRIL